MDLVEAKLSGKRLFRLNLPGIGTIYFYLPNWKEYKAFSSLLASNVLSAAQIEDIIFDKYVLNSDIIKEVLENKAGIISTVASLIMRLSGTEDIEVISEMLNLARERSNLFDAQIISLICHAFPAYKPEDIENMSWSEVILRLAQAEQLLIARGLLEKPLELTSPNRLNKVDPKGLIEDAKKMQRQENAPPVAQTIYDDPAYKKKLEMQQRHLERITKIRQK